MRPLTIFPVMACIAAAVLLAGCSRSTADDAPQAEPPATAETPMTDTPADFEKLALTPEEWKQRLSGEEYRVLREKGTERAFTSELNKEKRDGTFHCAGCGLPLFASATKFNSGTGWPSFYQPIAPSHVVEHRDNSHGMIRIEVVCGRCDGHLGHVFDDGPQPTGLRYCINGISLAFKPAE